MSRPRQPYRSLLLAGVGSVGRAVLRLGAGPLGAFERLVLVDRDAERLAVATPPHRATRICADIEDPAVVRDILTWVPTPAIVINLCAGVDTVVLRRALQSCAAAYVDAGASRHPDTGEARFSRMMPYTLQPLHGDFPHLLCQGVNPGLVEVVAQQLMGGVTDARRSFSVVVLEEDLLHSVGCNGRLVSGWSPPDLVEEVMKSPTLQIADGRAVEFEGPGSLEVRLAERMGGGRVRAVAHEDVWNLGRLPAVSHAVFLYRLHDRLMAALRGEPEAVIERLALPTALDRLSGSDTITVAACHLPSGAVRARRWSVDHASAWKEGLNGVQVQTASGILFALGLLLRSQLGATRGTFTASAMLDAVADARRLSSRLFAELGIAWQPVRGFSLAGADPGPLHIHPADSLWRGETATAALRNAVLTRRV